MLLRGVARFGSHDRGPDIASMIGLKLAGLDYFNYRTGVLDWRRTVAGAGAMRENLSTLDWYSWPKR